MSTTAIRFDVDSKSVDMLLAAFDHAVSPLSLERFLALDAHTYLREQIELRFAYEGDKKSGGPWEKLSEATVAIRESQGYPGDSPINMRTGNLEDFLATHLDVTMTSAGAILQVPGDAPQGELADKLRTAQEGSPPGDNPMFPDSETPPRPVLAADAEDLTALVALLELHIMREVHTVI